MKKTIVFLLMLAMLTSCSNSLSHENLFTENSSSSQTPEFPESFNEDSVSDGTEHGIQDKENNKIEDFDPEVVFTKELADVEPRSIRNNWEAINYISELLELPTEYFFECTENFRDGYIYGDYRISSPGESLGSYDVEYSKRLYLEIPDIGKVLSYYHARTITVSEQGEIISDILPNETITLGREDVNKIYSEVFPALGIKQKEITISSPEEALDYIFSLLISSGTLEKEFSGETACYIKRYYCADEYFCEGVFEIDYTGKAEKTDANGNIYYEIGTHWQETRLLDYVDIGNGAKKPLFETTGDYIYYAVYPDGKIDILRYGLS